MYCRKCGTPNDDSAIRCGNCGEPMAGAAAAGAMPVKPQNYLAFAIFITLCCCIPFGIVGIVYAAQANARAQVGDLAGAAELTRKAKIWCWWGFGVGLVVITLYTLLVMLGTVAQVLTEATS